MLPKEIDRASSKIFQSAIPNNWAIRDQQDQEDFGIDYEIELMDSHGAPTGIIFKVQQKGHEKSPFSADAKSFSYSGIPIQRVKYYVKELSLPLAFAVVTLDTKKVYWTIPQNDDIYKRFEEAFASGQKTMSLTLETSDTLPDGLSRLVNGIATAADWLFARELKRMSPARLLKAVVDKQSKESLKSSIENHHNFFRLSGIHELLVAGRFKQGFDAANGIFQSISESGPMRFAAALEAVRAFGGHARQSRRTDPEAMEKWLQFRLHVTTASIKLLKVPKAEIKVRLYARFSLLSSVVRLLASRDFALFISERVQTGSIDFAVAFTRIRRRQITKRLAAKLEQWARLLRLAVQHQAYDLLAPMWSHLTTDVGSLVIRMREENLVESAQQLEDWLLEYGRLAVDAAQSLGNDEELHGLAINFFLLANRNDPACISARLEESQLIVSKICNAEYRSMAEEELAELEKNMAPPDREMTSDEEREMIISVIRAQGIDLNDGSTLSKIMIHGLEDLNPERVLKGCKYRFVKPGSIGIPAQMVGLHTAGLKYLICDKLEVSIGSMSLDSALEGLKSSYCEKCEFIDLHPAEWSWTRKWQQEQDKLHGSDADK